MAVKAASARAGIGSRPTMIIYHNPRCSKSRQALALLRENGVEPEETEPKPEEAPVEETAAAAE